MPQPSDQVRIRTGREPDRQEPADNWAKLFQEYAALAAIVYRNSDSRQVPDPAGWRRSTADGDEIDNPNSGLYYEVWERGSEEVAIVIRGTRVTEFKDWWSNARWVTRFIPTGWDQYNLIRSQIQEVVGRAKQRHPQAQMVAVGHSLGGGLAQHVAYAHPKIDNVFAFDSSPVTGFRSVPRRERNENRKNVKISRVYEKGEILAFIRGLVRWVIPLSVKDPEIVEVRFNFRDWEVFGAVRQHSMVQLGLDLQDAAQGHALGAPAPTLT